MAGPVVHFEIVSKKAPALMKFYAKVFGWKIDADNPMKYGMVKTGAKAKIALGGGICAPSPKGEEYVTFYIAVDDLDATLKAVKAAGGKTAMKPMQVPGGPLIAQFKDPAGNIMGILKG